MRNFLALLMTAVAAGIANAADQIEIEAGDFPLKATLYRPAGDGPHPAVVAMHGCGGLLDRAGRHRPEYADWAERLVAAGFAVLFPDSYTSRGLGPQCTVQRRGIRPDRERLGDAYAARHWLQSQSWVQADRVSLLGWSQGAVAALWTVRPRAAPKDDKPDFRAAVAFYPGCRRLNDTAWSARIPTLILLGASDDWARARDCEQMVAQARGRSAHATIVKYRGAYHYFDRANLPFQERTGQAFTPDGSGRVHVGSNADARADVLRRVPEWLRR
ncbi:MAG TPA: dienelactone hydrolase family protein [Pseudorhodoplanes sp.]|jgi:dienelactone hydrolase|nr:dienelactone hydrolase family protein [Pseudorhodoplanes sp.]